MRPHIIVSIDDIAKEATIVIEGKNRFDDGFMPTVNATIQVQFTNFRLTSMQLMVSGLIITVVSVGLYLVFVYEYGIIERKAVAMEQERPELPKSSPSKPRRVTFGDQSIQSRKVLTQIQEETEISTTQINNSFIL